MSAKHLRWKFIKEKSEILKLPFFLVVSVFSFFLESYFFVLVKSVISFFFLKPFYHKFLPLLDVHRHISAEYSTVSGQLCDGH